MVALAIVAPIVAGAARRAWHDYENRPQPLVASDEETRAMVQAILAHARFEGAPPPPPEPGQPPVPQPKRDMLLLDRTLCLADESPGPQCTSSESADDVMHLQNLPQQWKREMLHANRANGPIGLRGIPSTRVVTQAEISAVFARGWWDDFHDRYPLTAGFAAVSRPVLSKDRQQALVYFAHHCGGTCGGGDVFVLQREGRAWRVIDMFGIWIS